MWGKGYISQGQVRSFLSSFLILKCKISKIQKIFAGGALIFIIHISRFMTDAGFLVDIDFSTKSNFCFSRSSSFHL